LVSKELKNYFSLGKFSMKSELWDVLAWVVIP